MLFIPFYSNKKRQTNKKRVCVMHIYILINIKRMNMEIEKKRGKKGEEEDEESRI